MFLIRAVFWLSLVILLIPADPKTGADAPSVGAIEALMAARATIADMSAFCERNPDVCVTGSAALHMLADKAENGVQMIYRYLDGTGASEKGTLKPEDMTPAWRAPEADRAA